MRNLLFDEIRVLLFTATFATVPREYCVVASSLLALLSFADPMQAGQHGAQGEGLRRFGCNALVGFVALY